MKILKGYKKVLSILLAMCLLVGMTCGSAFAQDNVSSGETGPAVSDEGGTGEGSGTEAEEAADEEAKSPSSEEADGEAAEEQSGNAETGEKPEADAGEGTESSSGEESESSTEDESENSAGEKTEGGTKEEAEEETATLLLGSSSNLCEHGNSTDECVICKVETRISGLPSVSEISVMENDEQIEIYTEASDICDIYYDELTEEEQLQVSNINTLWDVLDYFSSGVSQAAAASVEYLDENGKKKTCSDYTSVTDQTTWGGRVGRLHGMW
ncbi:MAG: hypothetical protein LIO96_09050 [Lachnospiraceae bacterium]|nr:hypothetical protein [Lachnospiraceae bacterium]